jgi:hypothetical protein
MLYNTVLNSLQYSPQMFYSQHSPQMCYNTVLKYSTMQSSNLYNSHQMFYNNVQFSIIHTQLFPKCSTIECLWPPVFFPKLCFNKFLPHQHCQKCSNSSSGSFKTLLQLSLQKLFFHQQKVLSYTIMNFPYTRFGGKNEIFGKQHFLFNYKLLTNTSNYKTSHLCFSPKL